LWDLVPKFAKKLPHLEIFGNVWMATLVIFGNFCIVPSDNQFWQLLDCGYNDNNIWQLLDYG